MWIHLALAAIAFSAFESAFAQVVPTSSTSQAAQATSPTLHLVGGRWFDGHVFMPADFYIVDGRLTHTAPPKTDTTVDLRGGYVVPPFGDAHEHYFDDVDSVPEVTQHYLRDGIFYAQGVTDITSGAAKVVAAKLVNTSSTVDVTYAHGGLTAVNGHPKDTYERFALNFFKSPLTAEQNAKVLTSKLRVNDAYWEIGTPRDLEAIWPRILAAKPDLIKVYLLHSEGYSKQDRLHPPLGKGLDPALVPLITARAHAAGLKVVAHVDTAADFHNALIGGVDEMAHMPGYYIEPGDDLAIYRLADDDIALARKRKVKVIATASSEDTETTAEELALTKRAELDNLTRLKQAGVPVLFGSDYYSRDTVEEARYLKMLGVWSNVELLRMYAVDTPQDIFPRRKIGELREGYEASFLVLKADPLADWTAVEQIADRWKQGVHLTIAPAAAAAKTP